MKDSEFWRDLAVQFRELLRKFRPVFGDRGIVIGRSEIGNWRLRTDSIDAQVEFEALARRGAMHLEVPACSDLLTAWLEALAHYDAEPAQTIHGSGTENGIPYQTLQTSYNLAPRSANYCKVLESLALDYEAKLRRAEIEPAETIRKEQADTTEAIQAQLKKLRLECNWTIEDLARKTGLDLKTVKRHLSGRVIPRLGNIAVYQQAFSKELKRQVLIDKMPPKRPQNAP